MGYAEPDFNSVANGSKGKTTKKKTTKKAQKTTKKRPTAKRTTRATVKRTTRATVRKTTKSTAKRTTRTAATTKVTTSATAETKATTKMIELKELNINASAYDLQIGDSVKLDYSVKPSNAPAVVGYFCDQEGIIEIGAGGDIIEIG